ncbi:MAG: hypothetical protein R3F31_23565 [Verrucomicrobiales bacterium]
MGKSKVGEYSHGGGFTRPIGADEAHYLPTVNGEGYAINRLEPPK